MINTILADLKDFFHLEIQDIQQKQGGWLSNKYIVTCIQGKYVVNIFPSSKDLHKIEEAAIIQMQLQNEVPCPQIIAVPMRHLDGDIHYQLTSYVEGEHKDASTITHEELKALGKTIATLNQTMTKVPGGNNQSGYNFLNSVWHYHHQQKNNIDQELYVRQTKILQSLSASFFDYQHQGFCHKNISADNILFNGEEVTIVDFENIEYSYVLHDVGRAILSFCLENETLNEDKIAAFISGYQEVSPMDRTQINTALKITWCIESPWWINKEGSLLEDEKASLFKQQLLWLTEHFFEL